MSQINPSTDWPLRADSLTGDELFMKQNSLTDSTPDPKEEMVTSQLLSNLALSKIQSFSLSGDTLTLNIDGASDLSTVLTSENGIFSIELLPPYSVEITMNNDDVFILDLSQYLFDDYVVTGSVTSIGNTFRQIGLETYLGNNVFTNDGFYLDSLVTQVALPNTNILSINLLNGDIITINLDTYAQKAKLSSITIDNPTYTLSFNYPDSTSISVNISDFANKFTTHRIYKSTDAVSPADVGNILYHYRHLRTYNNFKIKNIHAYVFTAGVNSGSLVLRCETPSSTFNLPAIGVGSTQVNLPVDLALDENFYLNIFIDSNSFAALDAPKGLYINITLL